MSTCLVLGATGFIGGQIARAALGRGWRVRGLRRTPGAVGDLGDLSNAAVRSDDFSRPPPATATEVATTNALEWRQGDLNDGETLAAAMQGCEVVFHCAGAYPHNPRTLAQDIARAAGQMRNVLDAARRAGVRRLIYTSSYTTIGQPAEPGRLADERDFYVPGSSGDPYYEAKWAMEAAALDAARTGLPVIVLCPVAVFGPGDVHMSVSGPLLMAARGRLPAYLDAPVSVIDVRDTAAAHLAAVERGRPGERILLSAHNVRLYDVLAEMARAAGARPPQIKLGPALLRVAATVGQLAPGGQASFLKTISLWQPVNNAKAVAALGLTTRPLAETLADTAAWFRARGYL